MDADRPLKELSRLRPRDLLGLTGEAEARLVSTDVVKLTSLSRGVDTVVRLQRRAECRAPFVMDEGRAVFWPPVPQMDRLFPRSTGCSMNRPPVPVPWPLCGKECLP